MELKHKLEKIFNDDYPGTDRFIADVIEPIFGNEIEYINDDLAEREIYADKAKKAGIKHIKYIGDLTEKNYNADNIALLDVTLDDSKNIERSRVNIQQLIRSIMDYRQHLMIVFHYEDVTNKQWRFSYAHKGNSLKNSTSAKRYTYVFGQGYRGRTAAERFQILADSSRNDEDFEKAFSVAALSDEFFDLYRAYYAAFVEYLTGEKYTDEKKLNTIIGKWDWLQNDNSNQFTTTFDGNAKEVRDYIKKMFGRIVFLYFLQRKGWLYDSDGNADPRYMRHLFDGAGELKNTFLDDVLELLFFYVLNTKPEHRVSEATLAHKDITILPGWEKIPFLNGGLFSQDDIDPKRCVFPDVYFDELFRFLDSYNFTIDENDQEDAEVGIDPEMLGRIFENLLEDNKDKGAFYTPKEIVDYMCRESIIAYLQNEPKYYTPEKAREFIETLNINILNEDERAEIEKRLIKVKICDPAIGSGAFPMGLVNLLSKLFIVLRTYSQIDQARMKRYIMEQSIYGVDIEQGAVDIARLRFWLAMVVDEPEARPLPNLHFKIMQGNSLLESYNGRDLTHICSGIDHIGQGGLDFSGDRQILRKDIKSFYNTSDHEKREKILTQITNNVIRQIFEATGDENFLQDVKDVSANQKFFLWHTWFADVFENGGFDIVIGNPPYLNVERMTPTEKALYKKFFKSFFKRSDMFALFIELSLNLSHSKGIVTMIISSVVHSNLSYSKLRDIILNQHWLQEVCYTGGDVFEAPTVDTTILRCNKAGVNEIILKRALDFDNPTVNVVGKDFFKNYKNIISIEDDSDSSALLEKLFNKLFVQVEELYSVFQGIVTGNNPVFIFDTIEDANEKVEKALLHPMCHGRDIERYLIRSRDRNITYLNSEVNLDEFPLASKWFEAHKEELSTRREVKKGVIKWYSLQWPRVKSELDLKEKILLQNTRNESLKTRLVAALDTEGVYGTQGLNFIIPKKDNASLRFLLGIINSKLLNYLFSTKFLNLAIKADYIKQVRIPQHNELIVNYVNEINSAKSRGASTEAIEAEIDHIVYHLYDLTYDEVLIVDPETPITREQYESKLIVY